MKSEWETLVDDERGTLKLEFNSRMVFLHLTLRQALAGMRAAKALFPDVLEIIRALGYRRVHVIIPEGNDALHRFEEFFGFSDLRHIRKHILMCREI